MSKSLFIVLGLLLVFAQCQEIKRPADFVQEIGQNGNPWIFQVPDNEVANVQEYGFGLWVRPSFQVPKNMNWDIWFSRWHSLAGVSEVPYGFCTGDQGARALAMWLSHPPRLGNMPAFHLSSYNTGDGNPWRDMMFPSREDYDHTWIYVYFSYSYTAREAFAYVYFSTSQAVRTQQWTNSVKKAQRTMFQFRVGSCNGRGYPAEAVVQGWYHDVQFYYGQSNIFSNNIPTLDRIRTQRLAEAPFPLYTVEPVRVAERLIPPGVVNINMHENNFRQTTFENLNGAREYAIYGWAKWTDTQRVDWHLIYRMTLNRPGSQVDFARPGDRTLCGWFGQGYLHFPTYNYNFNDNGNVNDYRNVEYRDRATRWFFIYHGYSFNRKKVFIYIKYEDQNPIIVEYANIWHILPDQLTANLGADPFYYAFNGQLKNWWVQIGEGAYRESNIEQLMDENYIPEAYTLRQQQEQQAQNGTTDPNLGQLTRGDPPRPQGDCAILYSLCNFQGDWQTICDTQPNVTIAVQSIYVPTGTIVRLYSQTEMQGESIEYEHTVQCLRTARYNYLQTSQVNLLKVSSPKKHLRKNHKSNTKAKAKAKGKAKHEETHKKATLMDYNPDQI